MSSIYSFINSIDSISFHEVNIKFEVLHAGVFVNCTCYKTLLIWKLKCYKKTGSSSLRLYIHRSFHTSYSSIWDMYIRATPAEASVGLYSILYSGMLMLLASGFFCKIPLSVLHIISNLVLKWLKKVISLFMCEDKDNIFRGYLCY